MSDLALPSGLPNLEAPAPAQALLCCADAEAAAPWFAASRPPDGGAQFTELLVELLPLVHGLLIGGDLGGEDAEQSRPEQHPEKHWAQPAIALAPVALPVPDAARQQIETASQQSPPSGLAPAATAGEQVAPGAPDPPSCPGGSLAAGPPPPFLADSGSVEIAAPQAEQNHAEHGQLPAPSVSSEQADREEPAPLIFAARLKPRPGGEPPIGAGTASGHQANATEGEASRALRDLPERQPPASPGAPPAPHSKMPVPAPYADSSPGEAGGEQRAVHAPALRSSRLRAPGREMTSAEADWRSSPTVAHQRMESPAGERTAQQPAVSAQASEASGSMEAAESQPAPRDIALRLVGRKPSDFVAVRLVERGGQIQVSVRTADNALGESLRRELPSLASRLHRAGFDAEIWGPGQASPSVTPRLEPARQPDGETGSAFQQGNQGDGQSDPDAQPRRQPSPDAWRQALESDENPALATLRRIHYEPHS